MYKIETPGVYIQDVILPQEMVRVLTEREIANQEVATYRMQEEAQRQRTETEHASGTAEMQRDLAKSQVSVQIKENEAAARKAEASGEAEYISRTGQAQGAEVRAIGMARADSYRAQVEALGPVNTALVNTATILAEGTNKFVPEVLVAGGGGSLDGLLATLTQAFTQKNAAQATVDQSDDQSDDQ